MCPFQTLTFGNSNVNKQLDLFDKMFDKFITLIFFQFVACKTIGRLSIKGVEHDLWIGTSDPRYIEIQGTIGFTLHGGGNLSLFRYPVETYSLDKAWPVSKLFW